MEIEHQDQAKYVSAQEGLVLLCAAGIKLSKNTFYQELGTGGIPSIRIGKKFFVRSDIVALMGAQKE